MGLSRPAVSIVVSLLCNVVKYTADWRDESKKECEVGSDVLPTSEIPESVQQQRNIEVWLHYERNTTLVKAKGFPQCSLIKVLSIRKRD